MSELDLGGTAAEPVVRTSTDLVLVAPAPVAPVAEEQAAGMLPLEPEKVAELRNKATAFASELVNLDIRSPEFTKKIDAIATLGDAEIRASANVSNRMLERPAAALQGARGGGGDATSKVSKTLGDLRTTVTELDPGRADLTGARKLLKFLPGGDKLQRYFERYQSAQGQIDAIIKALASGQDELRKDNAAIESEKVNMWTTMGKLTEYAGLAGELDAAVSSRVTDMQGQGRTEDANAITSDALFPIRQRRQDILTQLAVSAQGYLALDLVRKNNIELIKGVDRAQTTTISALRTAVIVAQALSNQRLVLDQITALNSTTSGMIQSTSELLKTQGAAIHEQAATSVIDIDALKTAFDNVFATMDAIDTYKAQAVANMSTTVSSLEEQVGRSKAYLERSRQSETG